MKTAFTLSEASSVAQKRATRAGEVEDERSRSRKKRKSEADIDEYSLAAAFLRSDGHSQLEIADRLAISQPDVSRYLERAKSKSWLQELNPRFTVPDEQVEKWNLAKNRFFSGEELYECLVRRFPGSSRFLRKVTLVHSLNQGHFGPSLVAAVCGLIADVTYCGITWGRTIRHLAELLEQASHGGHQVRDRPIQFIPLCGEPLLYDGDPGEYSSSRLSARLNRALNGTESPHRTPSLYGVPASIPLSLGRDLAALKNFITHIQGYSDIFGASGRRSTVAPLIDRVEAILTSVGVACSSDRGVFLNKRIGANDITARQVESLVAGDIGGIVIAKEGLTDKQSELIDRLNQSWNGVTLARIQRLSAEASDSKPGMVVLASGGQRKEVVLQCIKLNLVNHLIVDQQFAVSVLEEPWARG
jgi:DNA-binding transcriptional regulator LsrR (DeoR family)